MISRPARVALPLASLAPSVGLGPGPAGALAAAGGCARELSYHHGGNPLFHAPPDHSSATTMYGTTILSVRKGDTVAIVGDGQVTQGSQVVKPNARKVRRLGGDSVIAGFAGATADAFTLVDRLESKVEMYPGQLTRACVELAKEWRTERYLRHLEAVIIVVDPDVSLTVTGVGDVVEPADGVIAIGSGGHFALAAARALMDSDLTAMEIAEKAMGIAASLCVYTNDHFTKDSLTRTDVPGEGEGEAVEE